MENVKPDSKRKILLLIVWAMLIALDAAGLVWNIVRFSAGTISEGSFSYSLLHFFVSIGTISVIFIAEWLLRFRAGTAIVICCMLFAFFGNTVSNVWHMYDYFPQWDMVLHSLSGVLFAVLGLGLASLLLRTQADGNAKVLSLILFALNSYHIPKNCGTQTGVNKNPYYPILFLSPHQSNPQKQNCIQ